MIVSHSELADIRRMYKKDTIAYTGGVFDLLHEGHLDALSKLHEYGKIAVVGVTTDERARFRKGPSRPAQKEATRLAVIDALRHVDYACMLPASAPGYEVLAHYTLEQLRPDFLVTSNTEWENSREWLKGIGTETVIIPRFSEGVSTTDTIQRILDLNTISSNQIH